MLEWLRFILAAALMLLGTFFVISSVVGVNRFKYVLNRMHAAALGDTMGILFIILGLTVISGWNMNSLKLLLLVAMWWLTSPVASHLISRLEVTINPHLEQEMEIATEDDPHKEVES